MHSSLPAEGLTSYSESGSQKVAVIDQYTDSVLQYSHQSADNTLLRAFALLLQACRAHL